jgi:hypothetical protein
MARAQVLMIACMTALVRGLSAQQPIKVRLVDDAALKAEVSQLTAADVASQPIDGTEIAMRLLGALSPSEDLAAIRRSKYDLDTAAQYDIRTKTLYIQATTGRYSPLDEAIIAHEYTYALLDQFFNLDSLLKDGSAATGYNSDALLARQAIVEGDAFNTMLTYATTTFSRQQMLQFNQQLQRSDGAANPPQNYPDDQIGFPAAEGTAFIRAILAAASHGKQGNAAKNAQITADNHVFTAPPEATSEVLNPALYLQHAGAWDPTLTAPDVHLGTGWTEPGNDVFGAFGIVDLLGNHDTLSAASVAAAQWQADRYTVYQRGADTAMLWHVREATPAGAQAFLQALVTYTARRFHTTLSAQTSLGWHTAGYAMAIRVHGTDVAVGLVSNQDLLDLLNHALSAMGFS